MGQALDTMSPSRVIEGEIEVCHEATMLLQTLEEQRTEIRKVSSSKKLESPQDGEVEDEQETKVRQDLGIKDFYEEHMERTTGFDQMDEQLQLADVLYALKYLSLPTNALPGHEDEGDVVLAEDVNGGRRTSASSLSSSLSASSSCSTTVMKGSFSRLEIHKTLKEVFDVDDAAIDTILHEIRRRDKPVVTLHLHVIEAKELRPKTSKGTTHSYCIVKLSGTEMVWKTEVVYNDIAPFWDCPFLIDVSDYRGAKITIEIWHEPQESSMDQIGAVRDLREIGRVVLGTNEFKNLLGSVTIDLETLKNDLTDSWHPLVKNEETKISLRDSFRANKKRGSLHLSMKTSVKSQLNLLGTHWYDTLLNKLLQHRVGFMCLQGSFIRDGFRFSRRSNRSSFGKGRSYSGNLSVKNASDTLQSNGSASTSSSGFSSSSEIETSSASIPTAPWPGTLSRIDLVILSQYGAVLNLTPPLIVLSWWKIISKLTIVDQSYLGTLLKNVIDRIHQKEYSDEELKEATNSLRLWASDQEDRLKNLHAYFPASSRVISHLQLSHTLRNLKIVEAKSGTLKFGILPDNTTVVSLIEDAVTKFTKDWWERTLENCDRNSPHASKEQQLEAVVIVTGEVFLFLRDVCNFYEAVFKKETDMSYLKLSYRLLTSELAARIRPLLLKLCEAPSKPKCTQMNKSREQRELESQGEDVLAMDDRGPVRQLYNRLENISVIIGEKLPEDVQQQCGITGYHSWFLKIVMKWQEQMLSRSKPVVKHEVEEDDFKESSLYKSASVTEVCHIFKIAKTMWLELNWPYEVDGDVITKKLLENLCYLGKYYAKLVINKLSAKNEGENPDECSFYPLETCIALNNIEFLREEVQGLPNLLQLDEKWDVAGKSVVISDTLQIMEKNLLRFINKSVEKMKPALKRAVITSCDKCSENPLLSDFLDGEFCRLKRTLHEKNLRRILLTIWNSLVLIFSDVVKENSYKQKAEYFSGVHKVLDRTWHFFTPVDRSGLEPEIAHTTEYQYLKNDLSHLKMGTEFLIAKYYRERYEEQQRQAEEHQRQTVFVVPELIVHVFFTNTSKLQVEVIMARNIAESTPPPEGIRSPFNRRKFSLKQPDTYVQVKLVPSAWFPDMVTRTKICKKSTSPYFEETFQFDISSTDHSAKVGLLNFTLKTKQLVQAHGFIGEAILPLDTVPRVEYSNASTVSNKYLHLNMPKAEDEYLSLKALQFRSWDKKASNFLKELRDLKKKGNTS